MPCPLVNNPNNVFVDHEISSSKMVKKIEILVVNQVIANLDASIKKTKSQKPNRYKLTLPN